jgi:hypothetical protein
MFKVLMSKAGAPWRRAEVFGNATVTSQQVTFCHGDMTNSMIP